MDEATMAKKVVEQALQNMRMMAVVGKTTGITVGAPLSFESYADSFLEAVVAATAGTALEGVRVDLKLLPVDAPRLSGLDVERTSRDE